MTKISIRKWRISLLLASLLSVYVFLQVYRFRNVRKEPNDNVNNLKPNVVIFSATKYFNAPISDTFLSNCSEQVKNFCTLTNDGTFFSKADAVVFHSRDFNKTSLSQFPFNRRFEIPYVMWALENPYNARLDEYQNFFNWTMTYRKDSDVFSPYGSLVKYKEKVKINYTEIWNSKTKNAIWLVFTNGVVRNRRKEVVDKLIKLGMDIELLGAAFGKEPKDCPRKGTEKGCQKLHSPYKFTIAFENSNCKDYVTEKFFLRAAKYNQVPIVMSKRKIYRDIGIPDSMYISIDDFPNLKEFVDYIKIVSSNQTEYLKYHKWREDFRISDKHEDNNGFCGLCQKLMDLRGKPMEVKVYESMLKWHNPRACDNTFADRFL